MKLITKQRTITNYSAPRRLIAANEEMNDHE